ncbi:MAG TPA: DUF1622 domain-containing protein [Devosiaceae bacterium]|nr:DUF1622 domain-containing protein [Devosiaceae bacterium]
MLRDWLLLLTEIVVPLIDLMALLLITAGTIQAFLGAIRTALPSPTADRSEGRKVWIRYSRWLVAGLTFQLAADIVETSAAPTWDDVGKLAAIAVIRTFLNYFLERDQREIVKIDEERTQAPTRP